MKLRRLDINGLPGIREPFALNDVGDGFNVIVGPNGIGKSSLCRAVRSLLWAKGEGDGYIDVSALFDRGDQDPVLENRRRRIAMEGVETEDDHVAFPLPVFGFGDELLGRRKHSDAWYEQEAVVAIIVRSLGVILVPVA